LLPYWYLAGMDRPWRKSSGKIISFEKITGFESLPGAIALLERATWQHFFGRIIQVGMLWCRRERY